jgi:hypothetical protein
MVERQLSPEELDILQTFEKGRRLREVTFLSGWQDVLDILEQQVIEAEFALINYAGSDKDAIALLQRAARAKRQMFEKTQTKIAAAISAANEIPEFLQPASVGTPGARW